MQLDADEALRDALASSQRLGMLGDRPIDEIIDHARAFVAALAGIDGLVVDLGSGGGVPGLVVATARLELTMVLVDRRAARTDHLLRLVRRLGIDDRVSVRCADAMALTLPTPASAVVARGFGPPAITAQAARRLLADGGRLIVSDPPGGSDRWRGIAGFEQQPWSDRRVAVLRHVPRGTSP